MSREDIINNVEPQPVYGELAIISSSGATKQCMLLKKNVYTIGRSRRCDVRINIKTVSRLHVTIQRDRLTKKMTLANCGSGEDDLFVNKVLVKQGKKVSLRFGDVITLSGKMFKLYSPRKEHSVILDETRLCSQPPSMDRSGSCPIPGGGILSRQGAPQPVDFTECQIKKMRSPSLIGVLNGVSGTVERWSPFAKNSSDPFSDLALGTPKAETNTNTSKSVRFSHFNEVKAEGIQAYSPATKRRRLADRKPTPGPGRLFKSGQLPQEGSRNPSFKKRLSERKQVLKRTESSEKLKNQERQHVKQKLSLTPKQDQRAKTEDDRRKEIMRILLASSSPPDAING